MHDLLIENICNKASLTDDEKEVIKKYFIPRRVKKRQFLLREGSICDRVTFVTSGALAAYSIDDRGVEHVMSFAFEGCWTGDLVSLQHHERSRLNIEALEDCELLQMRAEYEGELFALVPSYERFMRIKYQDECIAFQRRIECSVGLSAEHKYHSLINQFPILAKRAPLNRIASYLGVTPATLSRIRKQKYEYMLA